jgi:transcription termination factor Rho
VKEYFKSKGIADERLIAKGYGDTMPSVDPKGLTGAALNNARTKNRRVEFKLVEGAGGGAAPAPKAEAPKAEPKAEAPKADPKAAPKADAPKAVDPKAAPKK